MKNEILYTPEEVSHMLRLSKYTIYEMIKRGELPAYRIGRSLRISSQQLETCLPRVGECKNIYRAVIEEADGQQYAVVNGIRFAVSTDMQGEVGIAIRPEEIILSKGVFQSSARNCFAGTVIDIQQEKNGYMVLLDIGFSIAVAVTKRSLEEMDICKGDSIYAVFKTMAVRVVP